MQIVKNIVGSILRAVSRLFLIVAVFFVVVAVFVNLSTSGQIVPADYDPIKEQRAQINKTITEMRQDKTDAGKLKVAMYQAILCKSLGEECDEQSGNPDEQFNRSLVGKVANAVTLPYMYPAASGTYAVYQALNNADFIPDAYASEGIGFGALKPISALWKVFRDIAYLLLVLFIVAIGFMIMFRMNINPQTVVTLENALPKIVITLILITFSYAIAGFLIDFMYVLIVLSVSVLAKADPSIVGSEFQNEFLTSGPRGIFNNLFPFDGRFSGFSDAYAVGTALSSVMPKFISAAVRPLAFILLAPAGYMAREDIGKLPKAFENIGAGILGNQVNVGKVVGGIASVFTKGIVTILFLAVLMFFGLPIVFAFLVLFTFFLVFFKIFFLLLFTYIRILLMIIFSPILLLFEAIPGRSTFSFWFKSLFGELLTFPLVVIFLMTGRILIDILGAQSGAGSEVNLWQPPFLGELNAKGFSVLLGFGILFMIPNLVRLVKELIGAKPLPLPVGIGTYFGGATGVGGGALGILSTFSSLVFTAQILNLGERLGFGKSRPGQPGAGRAMGMGALTEEQLKAGHAKHVAGIK